MTRNTTAAESPQQTLESQAKSSTKKTSLKKRSTRWLMKQSSLARTWLSLSIFLAVASGLLVITQALILAKIIDHVYLHHMTRNALIGSIYGLLAITICRTILAWAREYTGFKTADLIKTKVRFDSLAYFANQTPDTLSKQKTGALTTTLIERIEALHNFYADYLPQMTIVIVLPLIILTLVFMQNWVAGTILLITGPLIPLFMALIGMGVESLNQRHFQSLSRLSAHFLNTLQGLTTLTLFNRAKAQTVTIYKKSENYREKTMRVLRVAFLSSSVLELFTTIAIAMIAVYLGLGLLDLVHVGFAHHTITLSSALFILLLAPEFFMPLRQLGTFYHARAEAVAAATELLKFTKTKDEQLVAKHNFVFKQAPITCNNITFTYPNQLPVLNNFNLQIKSGELIAITGPSGIGKSTLLKLIAKLQTPQSGKITIDETNLNDIDTETWRSHLSLLTQNPYLFHDTLWNNIALGQPDASDQSIQNAARAADVLSFALQLPNGLQTQIGEQQLGLSGGQAQRIALARAYLKDAPIILLDEPTAHLDHDAKEVILNAIKHWKGKKTIIIATHDQTVMQLANQVVTL